jgi:hypothetical protein
MADNSPLQVLPAPPSVCFKGRKTMARTYLTGALAALSALCLSAPASATTFDAFASFNAAQGTGGFSYGSFDGTTFTLFSQNTGCVISAVTCLRGAGASLPSVYKPDGTATTSGTVVLSPDRLIGHPGEGSEAFFVAFTAPFAGTYSYTALFGQSDSNTAAHSVAITEFFRPVSGGPAEFYPINVVDQAQPDVFTGFTLDVQAGDIIGYLIDNNGSYLFDSTGFNFTLTTADAPTPAVPEPASWAMMILGLGIVGGALRRRPSLATTHA